MSESPEPGEADPPGAEAGQRDPVAERPPAGSRGRRAGEIMRSVVCVLLIVLGVLCLMLAPVVIWGRNLLLNTDRYVQTMEPLASDPGVQQAVVTVVSNQVTAHLDVSSIVADTLPPRARVLAGPLQTAVDTLVTNVTTRFVQSDAFHTLWVAANRVAHTQVVYLLTGTRPPNRALTVNASGVLELNLAPIVEQVKDRLVSSGLTIANSIPTAGATIEIADVRGLERARTATRELNRLAIVLPLIGLVLIAGGIATARKRRRALIVSALALGAGMIFVGVDLIVARDAFLNALHSPVLTRDTASSIFDTLVRFLRWGIRLVLLVALLIALGAWLSGPSRRAVAARKLATRVPRALGAKLDAGPVGAFVVEFATPLRVGVVVLMLIILLLIDGPTLATFVLLAVIAAVLLLLIEVLRAGVRSHRA